MFFQPLMSNGFYFERLGGSYDLGSPLILNVSKLPRASQAAILMIIAAQIRAARALLGFSQTELADLADIGVATVKRIELTSEISGSARTFGSFSRRSKRRGWSLFLPTIIRAQEFA